MKKFIKTTLTLIGAIVVSSVLVSATVAATADKHIEFSSSEMPALNCKMSLGQAQAIYKLLPQEIRDVCRSEYFSIKDECTVPHYFNHEGVQIRYAEADDCIGLYFHCGPYKLNVCNCTWESLDKFFDE